MNADWMSFMAAIRTRPDVAGVDAYLARGVQALRAHPDVADATWQHDPRTHTVRFVLRVSYPIAPHVDALIAHRALHESLERAGFADTSLPPSSRVPVRLRIDSWPEWVGPR
jgi:hypothetical protein